jgi:mRNA-degrading endonuclease RelE of RelBE toxin-antitoxin system
MGSPPPFECRYTRTALRQLRKCPKREQMTKWIDKLAGDPFRKDANVKPLTGIPGGFRRRFGDWRVSYHIDQDGRLIEVFEIAPRGGAYR